MDSWLPNRWTQNTLRYMVQPTRTKSQTPLCKHVPVRSLLGVGVWPARTASHNLKSKYTRYNGNADLYQRDTMAKRSYYAEVSTSREPEPASKSPMTEYAFGKYQTKPIMGTNAMENASLPDFVEKQAYAYMSMSVTTGTAVQYRSAINIRASFRLPKETNKATFHNIRLHNADSNQIRDMIQNTQHSQPVTVGITAKLRESIYNAK